ncbi:hypothetical protein N0V90_011480 [Kalmusia sp. IMI 367209]|nr:hypothetical protein N0V90_011480 [Kalmusia sp. IMI 367209]
MEEGQPVTGSLYIYAPNEAAPILFTIFYALSAAVHIFQCHRDRSWRLIGLQPLCGVAFTLGYALRAYNAFDAYLYTESNLLIYILSQVCIFVCPPLLELANYHILGRTLSYIPHLSPLSPKMVLRVFGTIMLVIETLNSLGVSLSANPSSSPITQDLGKYMTLVALAMQILVILVFFVLTTMFHMRIRKVGIRSQAVSITLRTLYLSMGLIFVRCIYRLVEHLGNTKIDLDDAAALADLSPILRYEAFFFVFEAALMLIDLALWNMWNPGWWFKKNVYLGSDGVTEIEYEDNKRAWWARWLPRSSERNGYEMKENSEADGEALQSDRNL